MVLLPLLVVLGGGSFLSACSVAAAGDVIKEGCLQKGSCGSRSSSRDSVLMQVWHSKSSMLSRSKERGFDRQCRNVTADDPCYSHIVWAMQTGIKHHPGWYLGLTLASTWDDFQWLMHGSGRCPKPCKGGPPLPTAPPTSLPTPSLTPAPTPLPSTLPTPLPSPSPTSSPDLWPGTVFQEGALIPVGGEIRLYTVGTSNVLWESWPDQVNAMLNRLGYTVPTEEFQLASVRRPTSAPTCDDAAEVSQLDTPRIGRLGWSSWGFAYDSKDDCGEAGFRDILGHNVSCVNAWACNPAWSRGGDFVKPSEVAEEAKNSDVVILSNWVNDAKQRYSGYVCFGGERIGAAASTKLSIDSLRRLIRAVHGRNPNAKVLVMAVYPDANGQFVNTGVLKHITAINAAVESALVPSEPNTFFVNFEFPPREEVYQVMHGGHPNCRGDRVMATAVLEALFRHKVISRGLALDDPQLCLGSKACGELDFACCQRSALCYVSSERTCLPYGPGQQ
mmetsp:Transcript_16859/g.52758  ORF Transcript_16859/g.52758 Transcript_16859/m.52758 type:complete len:503 (-) Transcript_16859:40-1548(-)